jgi:hypothetical protein
MAVTVLQVPHTVLDESQSRQENTAGNIVAHELDLDRGVFFLHWLKAAADLGHGRTRYDQDLPLSPRKW